MSGDNENYYRSLSIENNKFNMHIICINKIKFLILYETDREMNCSLILLTISKEILLILRNITD